MPRTVLPRERDVAVHLRSEDRTARLAAMALEGHGRGWDARRANSARNKWSVRGGQGWRRGASPLEQRGVHVLVVTVQQYICIAQESAAAPQERAREAHHTMRLARHTI